MNPDLPHHSPEELEASLTALLLGELAPEQAAGLRRAIEQDAALAALHQRLKLTIDLVREAAAHPTEQAEVQRAPLKLSDRRRQQLLAHFKTVTPREFARPRRREWASRALVGAAAVVVGMAALAMLLPNFTRAKSRATRLWSGASFRTQLSDQEAAAVGQAAVARPLPPAGGQAALARSQAEGKEGLERFALSLRAPGVSAGSSKEVLRAPASVANGEAGGKPGPPAVATRTEIVLPAASETKYGATQLVGKEAAGTPAAGQSKESVKVFDLGNADTQEVSVDLGPLFRRGGSGKDGRVRGLGFGWQSVPLDQRTALQAAALAPGTTEAIRQELQRHIHELQTAELPPGATAGRPQYPAGGTMGDAYFATDPESRRVVTIADEATSRAMGELLAKADTAGGGGFGGGMMGGMGGGAGGGIPTVPKASKPAQPTVPQARPEASGLAVVNSFDTGLTVDRIPGTTTPAETTRKLTVGTPVARLTAEEASARGISVLGDVPLLGPLFLTNTASPSTAAGYYGGGAIGGTPAEVAEGGQTLDHGGSARPSAVPRHATGNLLGLAGPPVKGLPAQEQAANGAATTPRAGQGGIVNSFNMFGNVDVNKLKVEGLNLIPGPVRTLPKTPSLPAERSGEKELQSKQESGVSTEPAKAGRVDIALPSLQSEARPAQAETGGKEASVLSGAVDEKGKALALQVGGAEAQGLVEKDKVPNGRASESREKVVEAEKYPAAAATASARRYGLRAPGGAAPVPQAKAESDQPLKRAPAAPAAIPQPEVQTRENAFSTFSLNVSDVSFKLAAASLAKGQMPEPATVRSEEFINAFDYRDPEAPPGVPVAFAWERARYPFAHNRDLLRFSLKTAAQGRQAGRALNLVLLLDNSGSMERADRVRIIREALRVLAAQLQPADLLSVVAFARTARLWVDGVPGNGAAQVAEAVSGLTPQGGTNLEEAMNLAYQTALRHYLANGINRVVLLTDGAANLGNVDPEALKRKVEAHRKQGVALDCFGIGWEGYNDDLLEVLSRNGDGRYGFVNTPEEAATEFAGQLAGALQVAAADVKVQVEFNPARVTAYRQVGYAKHQLTKEQFRDNSVDAAEIGAAESGNALYVIETDPRGDGPLGIVRVRYKVPGTSEYREQEWVVPYTGKAGALEEASAALRLAATASAFSEWLVSSPFAGEVTPGRLLAYLGGVPEVYGADERPKRLEWMIRQAQSIAGR